MRVRSDYCAIAITVPLMLGARAAFGVTAVTFTALNYPNIVQIEAQGFNGRFVVQSIGSLPQSDFQTGGISSDGNTLAYFSVPFGTRLNSTTIHERSLATSSWTSVTVPLALDDIAYSNGHLYGVVANSTALQIVQINGDGTTSAVLTQSLSTYTGQWRLSGAVDGSELLATRQASTFSPTPMAAEVINPVAGTGTSFSIPSSPPNFVAMSVDTIVNLPGTVATIIPGQFGSSLYQQQILLPSGTSNGSIFVFPGGYGYGAGSYGGSRVFSDEFTYSWDSSHDPLVSTNVVTTTPASFNKLYRTPFVWQGSVTASLENGLAPDGTKVDNVWAANPFRVSGPTAMNSNVAVAAPGPFSQRTLGSGDFSVDLNASPRGIFQIDSYVPLTMTYVHDGITENNRRLNVTSYGSSGTFPGFGYDPISANIIGNGDLELSYYGWDDITNPTFPGAAPVAQDGFSTNHVMSFRNSTTVRQILEEATADRPMMLSFDYRLLPNSGSGTYALDVFLAGEDVAHLDLTTPGSAFSHYQVLVADPALENLIGTTFELQMTATGSATAYLDNFSLVAAPEPGTLGIFAAAGAMLLRKKRGR